MWCHGAAVRKKFARVVEEHDAVTEETPPLTWVRRDGVGGVVVGSVRRGTRGLMGTHRLDLRFLLLPGWLYL
jgi:hypothetical protein